MDIFAMVCYATELLITNYIRNETIYKFKSSMASNDQTWTKEKSLF